MLRRLRYLAKCLLLALLLVGCGPAAAPEPAKMPGGTGVLEIIVSVLPQKYFVERIGAEHVHVSAMVPPGASPAIYEPKPEQLKAVTRADAYFAIGVPFEKAWMERIVAANRKMEIVDSTEGIERQPMVAHHHDGEQEGHEEESGSGHRDESLDPHIWLSPRLVKIQAQTIYAALVSLDARHEAEYRANLESFLADIDALDTEIHATLAGVENRKFMVFHPSWGYFARDYDLDMIPIEVGGQEASAAELAALIAEARQENIKVIFAQPEFSTRAAETIATEIGGEVLLISSLALDWPDNLRVVARALAGALSQ